MDTAYNVPVGCGYLTNSNNVLVVKNSSAGSSAGPGFKVRLLSPTQEHLNFEVAGTQAESVTKFDNHSSKTVDKYVLVNQAKTGVMFVQIAAGISY